MKKFFFLSSDLKTTPRLQIFNIPKNKWKKQKKVFEKGKIFKIKNKYYVSADAQISSTERVYGLFSEGMFLHDYASHSVQDMYKNSVLSIGTKDNMRAFKLYLNRKLYDTVHSPALFDPEGNIYYFKQNQNYRVMYKNKSSLFQFEGFYGKPVEITEEGIYFIGPSLLGSSLYRWNPEKGIQRVSSSDRIIEAITLSPDTALICEIGPHSYQYKISKLDEMPEVPVLYSYNFDKVTASLSSLQNLQDLSMSVKKQIAPGETLYIDEEEENNSDTLESNQELSLDSDFLLEENQNSIFSHNSIEKHPLDFEKISHYHSIKHIYFSGIKASVLHDPITGYNGLVSLEFQDPLAYNSINFSYQQSLYNGTVQINYTNKVHRLAWDIQYIYKQGLENFSGTRLYHYIHEFSNGFSFPIFRSGYWSSSFSLKNAVAYLEFKDLPGISEYYFTSEPSLKLQYLRSYNQNFDLHRHFVLSSTLKYYLKISDNDYSQLPELLRKKAQTVDLESIKQKNNLRLQVQSHYMYHLGWDFYTAPFFSFQTALKKKSIPFRYFAGLNFFEDAGNGGINFFLRERPLAETNQYISTGLHLKKFIDTPLYFTRWPFSLIGIAPLFVGKYLSFTDYNQKLLHFVEWTFGLKTQLLFHHKIKLVLNLYFGYSYPLEISLSFLNSSFVAKSFNKTPYFGLQLESTF